MQGKSHSVQVKESYSNSKRLLIGFILQPGVYNDCTLSIIFIRMKKAAGAW